MPTLTAPRPARKPRPKPARTVRIIALPADGHSGVIRITVGHKSTGYYVDPIPSDFGLAAFRLTKFTLHQKGDGQDSYDLRLDTPGHSTCECKGFLRHQHCKHLDCLTKLGAGFYSLASASRHAPESVALTCLLCGEPLTEELGQYHEACIREEAMARAECR